MVRHVFAASVIVLLVGTAVATGAFTSGDEAVDGVYLTPADTANGDEYAAVDSTGELTVTVHGVNDEAVTVLDSLFNISSTRDGVDVWVESVSPAVTFYRMDTRQSISDPSDPVELSSNETVTVGVRIDSGVSAVSSGSLTVHAVLPTSSPPTTAPVPTTRSAGGGGGGGGGWGGGSDGSTPTQTPVPTNTAATPTATPTQSPSETDQQTTAPTEEGTTVPEEQPTTVTEPPDGNATTVPPATSPPPAQEPPTQSPTDAGARFELGGLSLPVLGGLLFALVALPLLFWGLGWLRGSPALVVTADPTAGLAVAPGRGEEDHYATGEDTVTFAFADSQTWESREDDAAVRFDGVVTLSNVTDDAVVATLRDDEMPESVSVYVGEAPVPKDGLHLAGGAERAISVEFPPDFEPDDDVTLWFEADASAE